MKKLLYISLLLWILLFGRNVNAQIIDITVTQATDSATPTVTDEPEPSVTDTQVAATEDAEPADTPTSTPTPTATVTPSPTPRAIPVAAVRPPRSRIQLPPLSFFSRMPLTDYYREQPLTRTETILLTILSATLFVWSMLLLMPGLPTIMMNKINALLFPRILRHVRINSYDNTL